MIPDPGATSFFLVERYVPVVDLDALCAAVARVGRACTDDHVGIRYVHSTYVQAEDTCFCVFEATSARLVRAVNDAARFGLDRIVPAIGLDAALTANA